MSDTLSDVYNAAVNAGDLRPDVAQAEAVSQLQVLQNALAGYEPPRAKSGLRRLFRDKSNAPPPKSLYLFGGVGRGKSMLMDMFYGALETPDKQRVHFHAFMQAIHDGLQIARASGIDDPLETVVADLCDGTAVLCFDELQITDITDAMIVGRLFEKLFARGVVIVTTSNRHPDALYKDGLNRKLFLPFIEMIKERFVVHEVASETDHRQQTLKGQNLFFSPLGGQADARVDALWAQLAGEAPAPLVIENKGRMIEIEQFSNGVARSDFAALCATALGPSDFLAIADAVSVLILEHIPKLSRANANEAKRFVTLIDALYEARVQFIASADAEPDALYVDGDGAFEFQRTASRLMEMRSADWAHAEALNTTEAASPPSEKMPPSS